MSLLTLHCHRQLCACGHLSAWSHLYQLEAAGTVTRMKPYRGPVQPDMAIDVEKIEHPATPICSVCIPPDSALKAAEAKARFDEARKRAQLATRAATSPTLVAGKPKRPLPPIETLA